MVYDLIDRGYAEVHFEVDSTESVWYNDAKKGLLLPVF